MFTPSEANAREYIRRVCKAMDYISARLADNPTLDEIAEAASFSKFHFHRIFKGVAGESVAEFTRRLRLEKSMHYLAYHKQHDITQIAHTLGFSSAQNFATAFRRHFNQTPSEYRAACAEQESKNSNTISNDSNAENFASTYLSNWIKQVGPDIERTRNMNVEVKDLPDCHVAYLRHIGPYGDEGIKNTWGRLMQWAGPRGFAMMGGKMIGLCWDNPDVTPPDKVRYDACIQVPPNTQTEGEIGTQTIPGGRYAIYHAEVKTDEFADAWHRMVCEWLPQSGYQPDDRPCFECYLNHADMHPEKKWLVDIHIPVKPL